MMDALRGAVLRAKNHPSLMGSRRHFPWIGGVSNSSSGSASSRLRGCDGCGERHRAAGVTNSGRRHREYHRCHADQRRIDDIGGSGQFVSRARRFLYTRAATATTTTTNWIDEQHHRHHHHRTPRDRLLGNNGQSSRRGVKTLLGEQSSAGEQRIVDTLIIGGGAIGSSVAYHLATSRVGAGGSGGGGVSDPSITVVEMDPTYSHASSVKSAGGIRQQFSLKENVQMCLYGRDFLRNATTLLSCTSPSSSKEEEEEVVDVQFQEHGYLFLASTEEGKHQLQFNHEVQLDAGVRPQDMVLLSPSQLQTRFPWLNVDDIQLGSYGMAGEGWFDPWSLLRGFRDKSCQDLGVKFVRGRPVGSLCTSEGGNGERRVDTVYVELLDENGRGVDVVTYHVNYVVNAAGAHASTALDVLAGDDGKKDLHRHPREGNGGRLRYPLPVRPRKRCIFFFHCTPSEKCDVDDHGGRDEECIIPSVAPLTVDPISLAYFRSEGTPGSRNFLCGVSPPDHLDVDCPDVRSLDCAEHDQFDDTIWPALYHRVPAFGSIKVRSSWAGWYDYNTIDQNAIIGFHPELVNVCLANGFSGHGLQCSPAAGLAVSELLENGGRFRTLDLSIFGFDRFVEGGRGPVYEAGIV